MVLINEEKSIVYMVVDHLTEVRDPFFVEGVGIQLLTKLRNGNHLDHDDVELITRGLLHFALDYYWSPLNKHHHRFERETPFIRWYNKY